jgi:hypothetical protein
MPLPLTRKALDKNNESSDKPLSKKIAYSKNSGRDIVTDEYAKKHPPIYLTNKNDDRIGYYSEAGNQYLFKEIVKPAIKKQKATEEQVKPLDRTPKLNKPERVELSMKKSESKPSSEGTEFKQGRKFMRETGLRPGFYKKDELAENSNKKIPIKRR